MHMVGSFSESLPSSTCRHPGKLPLLPLLLNVVALVVLLALGLHLALPLDCLRRRHRHWSRHLPPAQG